MTNAAANPAAHLVGAEVILQFADGTRSRAHVAAYDLMHVLLPEQYREGYAMLADIQAHLRTQPDKTINKGAIGAE